MPSIATYTSLESLLFIQSVARYGADTESLAEISKSLSSNKFVCDDENYSPGRLRPEALKNLYTTLIYAEGEGKSAGAGKLNGNATTNGSNPRKRKLSSPSPPAIHDPSQDDERLITALVDKLYAEYKEQVIEEIRQDEEEHRRLQQEIAALQREEVTNDQSATSDTRQEFQDAHKAQEKDPAQPLSVSYESHGAPDARPPSVQPQAVAREESRPVVPPNSDTTAPESQTSGTDVLRTTAVDDARVSLPPAQQSPALPAAHQRDVSAHHSPSPSVVNSQRAPPFPPSQSSQSVGRSPAPSPLNRTLPPPAPYPHHQGYGPINAQHAFPGSVSPRSPVILPPPPGMPLMTHHRTPSDGSRTPVALPHPQQYQPYPPYNFPQPAWPHQPHPSQQYSQHHPPYSNPNFYQHPASGGNMYPSQTPVQAQYPYYPQSAPANRQGLILQPAGPATGYAQHMQSASAMSTPVNNRIGRQHRIRLSGSSTPWTPKPGQANGRRPASPVRPDRDRDVSPLSDPGSPPPATPDEPENVQPPNRKSKKPVRQGHNPTQSAAVKSENAQSGRTGRSNRRKRAGSNTSLLMASESRSQSLASFASDHRTERVSTARKVKNEPPSTPAPLTSDNEQQRSSGLRRGRGNTINLQFEGKRSPMKRKRDSAHEPSPSPSLPTPRVSRLRPRPEATDPSLVAVTKNFARLTGPIINDVTTHKYAGLFAKPLTEREAPGYKDLIYHPQDLKSIKTAIGKGSRAANAAIEEIGTGEDETGTPSRNASTGTMQLKKTEDLAPPKAIVNSSQLEMELMRVYANAVMFNPLLASERGFGSSFKMQSIDGQGLSDNGKGGEGDEEGAKGYSYVQVAEGGIIADTRAMFEDVEKSVENWRGVEQGFGSDAALPRSSTGIGLALRGGSMSMSEPPGEESASEEEGTRPGTARKRRRVEA